MRRLGFTLFAGGADPLTIEVLPHVCFAPCTVRVRVQVSPEEGNRQLVVRMAGEGYESSSTVQLDGEESPKTMPFFWFRDVPGGLYDVDVILQRTTGEQMKRTQTVEVGAR